MRKTLLILTLTFITFIANAYDFETDGIYYNIISDSEVEVTFQLSGNYNIFNDNSSYNGKVVIPSTVSFNSKKYTVTQIGENAFNRSNVTSVEIPITIKIIGNNSFSNCYSLISVIIGDSVTSIGEKAFEYCRSLTNVEIGKSVELIGKSAFKECTSLASVYIGDSVRSIGNSIFDKCTSLTSVTFGDSIETIGNNAFSDCSALESIIIPDSVIDLGECTFFRCTSLNYVKIGNSVTKIGEESSITYGVFAYCTSLKKVEFGDSLNLIGEGTFNGCTSLESIDIPNSVILISVSAFKDCKSLSSVVIGESVKDIERQAFENCSSLKSVTCLSMNPPHIHYGGTIFNGFDTFKNIDSNAVLYVSAQAMENYVKESSWRNSFSEILTFDRIQIGDLYYILNDSQKTATVTFDQFQDSSNYKGISKLNVPDEINYNNTTYIVEAIGNNAFQECADLQSVTLHDYCLHIGDKSFYGCKRLSEISLGNSLISIGESAFYEDPILSINLPESLESIGSGAFFGCYLTSITLPHAITSIESSTFRGCPISKVVISDNINYIGDYAFYLCGNLESVTIGNGMLTIGKNAFDGCNKLSEVNCYTYLPPEAHSNSFSIYTYAVGVLNVLTEAQALYEYVVPWNKFSNINGSLANVESIIDSKDFNIRAINGVIYIDGVNDSLISVYDMTGNRVYIGKDSEIYGFPKGIYIIRIGNKSIKINL